MTASPPVKDSHGKSGPSRCPTASARVSAGRRAGRPRRHSGGPTPGGVKVRVGARVRVGSGVGQRPPPTSSVRYSTSSGHTSQPSAPKLSRSRRTSAFHRSSRWPRDMTPAEGARGCSASAVSAAAAAAWPSAASSAGDALYRESEALAPASVAASASAPPPPPRWSLSPCQLQRVCLSFPFSTEPSATFRCGVIWDERLQKAQFSRRPSGLRGGAESS